MRKYLDIDLGTRQIGTTELHGKDIAICGRYLIARQLLEDQIATVDPLSPGNPLIFSAGPFAGTNFSNGNRISVGCKSPLTGGIKEANSGGTFATSMGQYEIAGLTLNGVSDDWVILRFETNGDISFDDATPYLGLGNIEATRKLQDAYGEKISVALCGPVGEYQGLMAGITFTDVDYRPSRLAARGGVGALMGHKKVKAIVFDIHKMPPLHDLKKYVGFVREYSQLLGQSKAIETFSTTGTAVVADLTNHIGGLPTRNFSSGQHTPPADGPFKMGGDYIRDLNTERGGQISHACMRGCKIKCSNVFVDADGKELVSPLEYETLGLLGTNCGLDHPDQVAGLNETANDLGVDSIELGATIGVLMDLGQGDFGDVAFMEQCLADLRQGTERGRILAQGTARAGAHFGAKRIPVIKKQAISAYDPRVIEATGFSMMITAQGADHTVGNSPAFKSADKSLDEIARESLNKQVASAVADCFGLCLFGRDVTDRHLDLIAQAINAAHDAGVDAAFISDTALETLKLEAEFNRQAGFTEADDELPDFFYDEALAPTGRKARLHHAEVNKLQRQMIIELES